MVPIIPLCICFIAITIMAYITFRLGEAYFTCVSRNPTINDSISTNLLIMLGFLELSIIVLIVFGFILILK